MTADLTPEELGAREFWRQAATGSIPTHYFVGEFNRLSGKYSDLEFNSFAVELDQLVGDLGYGTDMATISSAMARGMATDLGHWAGTYGLVDEQDALYQLDVNEDRATLTLPSATVDTDTVRSFADYRGNVTLSSTAFAGGRLTLSNADHTATLVFEYATALADMARTDRDPFEIERHTQPRCHGEIRTGTGDSARTLKLAGKRGCYTADGIRRTEDGDPASTWAGTYQIMDITETGAWTYVPEPLVLRGQGDGLSVQWGDRSGSAVRCGQNALLADLSKPKAQLALRFEIVDGKEKRCAGVCRADGTDQLLHGYWIHPEPPASRITATRFRPMSALDAADPKQDSELELKLDATATNHTIEPSIGVPGHAYKLPVLLENADKLGPNPYTWTLTGFDKLRIVPDGKDPLRATLTGQFAIGDAGNKDVTLTVTAATGASVTFTGTFQVAILNMVVTPATLPPVVRRMDYRVGFEVNGGMGPYTWKKAEGSVLPGGLTFNAEKHELSGKVGTSASQEVYTLRLEVRSAKNVMMAPLKVSIPFSVNEPVQVGSEAMGYFQFVVSVALGSIFVFVNGARAIYDWRKSARRNAGDPNFHRGYQWADRMGKAITAGIDGAIGKNYATYIEHAVRYGTMHRERLLVDPMTNEKVSALEYCERIITDYNGRVDAISSKLERARKAEDDAEIKKQESLLEEAKSKLRRTLESTHKAVTGEERAAEDEKRDGRQKTFREKVARLMPGG